MILTPYCVQAMTPHLGYKGERKDHRLVGPITESSRSRQGNGLENMPHFQTDLSSLRLVVALGLILILMGTVFVSTLRMLGTRNARLFYIALLLACCAVGAWYMLFYRSS